MGPHSHHPTLPLPATSPHTQKQHGPLPSAPTHLGPVGSHARHGRHGHVARRGVCGKGGGGGAPVHRATGRAHSFKHGASPHTCRQQPHAAAATGTPCCSCAPGVALQLPSCAAAACTAHLVRGEGRAGGAGPCAFLVRTRPRRSSGRPPPGCPAVPRLPALTHARMPASKQACTRTLALPAVAAETAAAPHL